MGCSRFLQSSSVASESHQRSSCPVRAPSIARESLQSLELQSSRRLQLGLLRGSLRRCSQGFPAPWGWSFLQSLSWLPPWRALALLLAVLPPWRTRSTRSAGVVVRAVSAPDLRQYSGRVLPLLRRR